MNKIVVIGVVVVVIVAVIAVILLNHPNSNNSNYNSINTIVIPTTPTTTNVTTPTTTTTSPTTSATTNTMTMTSVNTPSNLPMNSFYFIFENSSGYYYIFVLNLTSFKEYLQTVSGAKMSEITGISIEGNYTNPTQIIEKGDYLFVIGYTNSNINLTPGNNYLVIFGLNIGTVYTTRMTFEGTWTSSIP